MKQQMSVRAIINLPQSKEGSHEMLVIMKKLVDLAADLEAQAKESEAKEALEKVSDMLCDLMFESEAARSAAYASVD